MGPSRSRRGLTAIGTAALASFRCVRYGKARMQRLRALRGPVGVCGAAPTRCPLDIIPLPGRPLHQVGKYMARRRVGQDQWRFAVCCGPGQPAPRPAAPGGRASTGSICGPPFSYSAARRALTRRPRPRPALAVCSRLGRMPLWPPGGTCGAAGPPERALPVGRLPLCKAGALHVIRTAAGRPRARAPGLRQRPWRRRWGGAPGSPSGPAAG